MHHQTNEVAFAEQCAKATCFAELALLAITELEKFEDGAEIVCGPISTGGRGSVEANFEVFGGSIQFLREQGRPIFSQMPYEGRIFAFRAIWLEEDPSRKGQYYMGILEEFYHVIFETRRIKKAYFIPGWQSSFGACWERERLANMGVEIVDLTDEWVDQMLASIRTTEPA